MNQPACDEIRCAKNGVTDAEIDLARLLSELEVASRAAKIPMSDALRGAFGKLRAARERLVGLESGAPVER